MALFSRTQFAINDGKSPQTAIQEYLHLHANNWDWTNTSADGRDLRITLPDGTPVSPYIASWDQVAKTAIIFAKIPTFSVGSTPLTLNGGNLALATASNFSATMQQFPNDADVIAQFPLNEGSGTNAASTMGGWVARTNATWVNGTGDGGAFGDRLVTPTFATGSYLQFRAANSNYFAIGDLLATYVPPQGSLAWWMRIPAAFRTDVGGGYFLSANKFGVFNLYGQFDPAGPNRIKFQLSGRNGKSTSVADNSPAFGASPALSPGDNRWHHICLTWGSAGAQLFVDGVAQNSDESFLYPFNTSTQDVTTQPGVPAAVLNFGCLYDPRPGNSSGFGNFDLGGGITVWSKQLTKVEVDQVRHRIKIHPISTAFTKLKRIGVVLPGNVGSAFNDNTWQEPNVFINPTNSAAVTMVVRAGGTTGGNGCRICRLDSTNPLNFGTNTVQLLGEGVGGEANHAVCPSRPVIDPVSGKYIMLYSRGVGASLFTTLCYADSTDGITYVPRGPVTVNGIPSSSPGNSALYTLDNGVTWNIRYETQYSTLYWAVYNATAGPYTASGWTFTVTSTSNSSLWRSELQDSSGPDVTIVGTINHTLLHCSNPSISYHRYSIAGAITGGNYLWSPYDQFESIRRTEIADWSNNNVTQTADPSMFQFTGADGITRTYIYCDMLTGGIPSEIIAFTYEGTITQLFQNSVRIDSIDTTYTLNWSDRGTSLPIVGGDVWVTTDVAGTTLAVPHTTTDSSGNITCTLTPGATYYFWGSANNETPVIAQLFVA